MHSGDLYFKVIDVGILKNIIMNTIKINKIIQNATTNGIYENVTSNQ